MTSTVSNEAPATRPRGGALAMAGAMVAGLAAGRSRTLVLAAGFTAGIGLKWMLRRNAVERVGAEGARTIVDASGLGGSPGVEAGLCCSGGETSLEPIACEVAPALEDAPPSGLAQQADSPIQIEEMPLVWEQGREEPVSRGAVGAQTVWFEMSEPAEIISGGLPPDAFQSGAIPAVPPLPKPGELPTPTHCGAATGSPASLPTVPAIAEKSRAVPTAAASGLPPVGGRRGAMAQRASQAGAGVPGHGVWNLANREASPGDSQFGVHRRVVPHAPVDDGRKGRWMMLVTAVVLVIAALAAVRGALQQNGWKFPWGVARNGAQERQLKPAGAVAPPLPGRGEGGLRSDGDAMIR